MVRKPGVDNPAPPTVRFAFGLRLHVLNEPTEKKVVKVSRSVSAGHCSSLETVSEAEKNAAAM